jgi:tetratricopeptide (TPR) repeat protein
MWVLLMGAMLSSVQAKPAAKKALTIEEEQQFLYYFYEAQRLIQKEDIIPAWELVQFCYDINPNDGAINNYMGIFLDAFDKKEQALGYFRRAFELQPNDYWYQYALYLLQSGDKKKEKLAIRNLEQVASVDKTNEDLHILLQKAYVHTGDYKRALQLQDKLDSIAGYNAMSAMQRYRLNALLKNNRQAIYEVERYLEEEPENVQFQVFRAQLYEQTHQPPEKMIEAYSALLRFDSRNLMLMNNLAWNLCLANRDLDRAEKLSRTTIMQEPSNPIYLDTYAWIMYLKGDYQSAFFYIQRALDNATDESREEITQHYNAILKKLKL